MMIEIIVMDASCTLWPIYWIHSQSLSMISKMLFGRLTAIDSALKLFECKWRDLCQNSELMETMTSIFYLLFGQLKKKHSFSGFTPISKILSICLSFSIRT